MAGKRCILGMSGFGKTTLARQLVRDVPRLLVFDPTEDADALRLDYAAFAGYLEQRWSAPRWRVALWERKYADKFCAWAVVVGKRVASAGGLGVVIDEGDLVARPNAEPDAFRELMARGRHYEIDVIGIARRSTEISRDLTALADTLYVFRTQEPRDVAYLGGIIGIDHARVLPTLQRYEYLEWTPAGCERKQLAVN